MTVGRAQHARSAQRSSIARFLILAACLTGALWPDARAEAQGVVYLTRSEGPSTALYELPVDSTGFGSPRLLAHAPCCAGAPQTTGDGRFVVWGRSSSAETASVMIFDRSTSSLREITGLPRGSILLDRAGPRILFRIQPGRQMAATDAAGVVTTFDVGPSTGAFTVSGDGTALYTTYCTFGAPTTCVFEVRSATTGALLRSVALPATTRGLVATPDARWLYALVSGHLVRLDGYTGQETGRSPYMGMAEFGGARMVIDETHQRVALAFSYYGMQVWTRLITVVDTAAWTIADVGPSGMTSLDVDSRSGSVVALDQATGRVDLSQCFGGTLRRIDLLAATNLQSMPVPAGPCFEMTTALAPLAPVLAAVAVTAGTVSLDWTPADASATHYLLEAGTQPGHADVATFSVATGHTLSVPNVPAGSYYVRVRAVNYAGSSLASEEYRVVVQ